MNISSKEQSHSKEDLVGYDQSIEKLESEKALTFEQALEKLQQILRILESGEIELEKAIELYEEGYKLQTYCHNILSEARLRVEKIIHDGQTAKGVEASDLQEYYDK